MVISVKIECHFIMLQPPGSVHKHTGIPFESIARCYPMDMTQAGLETDFRVSVSPLGRGYLLSHASCAIR